MKLAKISLSDKAGGGYVQDVEALESKATLPKRITRRYLLLGCCFMLLLIALAIRSLALENERMFTFKLPFDALPVISADSSPAALTLQTGEVVSAPVPNVKNLTATVSATRPAQVASALRAMKESAKQVPMKNHTTSAIPRRKGNSTSRVAKKSLRTKSDLRIRI
jgi:hypothetical protein